MVKYLFTLNYPPGKSDEYLAWVRSVSDMLRQPPELQVLRAWDNYFATVPQRVVEFEFKDIASAAKYFDRPAIRNWRSQWAQHCDNLQLAVLVLRHDYEKAEPE
jgi:quinol monooxygenase YgiN